MSGIYNDVINEYNNTGTTRYAITFEYDHESQVKIRYYDSTTNEYVYVTDWEFDGATAIRFTDVVPDSFQILRETDISQSFGTAKFSTFVQGGAIRASDLNGDFELLRQAIEEGDNVSDGLQDQIDGINGEIDVIQDQIDGLDDIYVNKTGDTMTGALSMSSNQITELGDANDLQDAVNLRTLLQYIDTNVVDPDPNGSSYTRYSYTASGGETLVTVPAYVSGGEIVFINGAEQTRNVDYTTTNNTTVTFTQPLLAGDVFDLYCVNTLKVIEVPLGDTSNLPVIRQTFTATADQTTFTLTGGEQYTPGKEQVFLNGNLLERDTDYTGNVGTSFVLEQGALADDQVEIFCVNYTVDGGANTASNVSYTYPGGVQRTVQAVIEELLQRVADRDSIINDLASRISNLEADHTTLMNN